jgi:hypothetical protein
MKCPIKKCQSSSSYSKSIFSLYFCLDVPGTWRGTFQKLISSQTGIWTRLFDGCHCDKETWRYLHETGFRSVNLSFTYMPNENLEGPVSKIIMYFIIRFMTGHAKK